MVNRAIHGIERQIYELSLNSMELAADLPQRCGRSVFTPVCEYLRVGHRASLVGC